MKLNTKGRYAVMAMADIAKCGQGKAIPMAAIAKRQHISLAYLEQLFSKLRRADLVSSLRGPGGGYVLSRPADKIYIGEIMQAVGEPVKMTRCNRDTDKDAGCIGGQDCLTHSLWNALSDHIYNFLASISLQDVLDKKVGSLGSLAANLEMVSNNKAEQKLLKQSDEEVI
ncbi:MAG: Rrf2 family transcriptional regulator [Hyphomicrobiaceae bacterium]|nr:Rrf2 family transcriptional regulator [Hyphomicrobiaceae bacterium]